VPAAALEDHRDRALGVYGERGGWRLHIRAWLVRHAEGLVLVDTGIGQPGAPAPGWYGASGLLFDALLHAGTTPDAIDTVVLTHVHDDHIGGTVVFDDREPVPAFPQATYLLQRVDREWQAELAADDEEDRVIDALLLQPLERSGQLRLIDGDHALNEGVALHLASGHTPGHQIVRLRSGDSRAIIAGDTFNHPIQISRPDLPSGPDASPAQAAVARRAFLDEVLSSPGITIAPTHFAEAFGQIERDDAGTACWRPV